MSDQPANKNNTALQIELAASEKKFSALVEAVTDYAIYILDQEGLVLTWNKGAQRIIGYAAEEISGKSFSLFYPQDMLAADTPAKQLREAVRAGRFEDEGWRVRKNGEIFWANVVFTPITEHDAVVGFGVIVRDLSERKQVGQNEQVFKLLVESVQDYAIFMLDPQGIITTWNEGAERIKGYKADDIIGQHFSTFYSEEAKLRKHPDHELKMAISEGRYQEEGWRVRKDGTRLWANVTITPVYAGAQLIGFAKVTRDLTERRESEQREEVFRLLVSGVRDYAIFMLSPDGNVLTWNEGAERIKGYKTEEILGKHFSIFYTREAQKRRHPQKELEIAKASGHYEEEGWRLRKDGSLLWANVVITAIYDGKKLLGFAKVTRDLTQRLLADQERQASAEILDQTNEDLRNALEIKSRFLSTISHEVRTPMAAIIGMTEMLAEEDLGADHNSMVQHIFDSSKRLLQLLNNLLESARMESGDLTLENRQFPIRVVLGDVRQMVMRTATEKSVQITGSCDDRIPETIFGDELKVRQILLNLLHNAVKFTDHGEVSLSAEITHGSGNLISTRFSVRDTGIGIKPEDRDKLFKPFSQADDATKRIYGGSGLGLSICKQLVELMGGSLNFESEFGKGSHFWCDIPFPLRSNSDV